MSAEESLTNPPEMTESALAIPCLPARYARFGNFQIDAEHEEIFRGGERIIMQSKVYQTLLILLSHAGDIVTREEVGRRLWPERSPANLDANVNTAMNKLRQALGDSSETPTYVETIPRRGYCFIAPLEFSDLAAAASAKSSEAAVEVSAGDTDSQASSRQLRYTLPMALRIATLLLAGMVVGALLVLVWYSFYGRNHEALNSTKDMAFRAAAELNLFRRPG